MYGLVKTLKNLDMNEKVFKGANKSAREQLTTLHRVVDERINKEKTKAKT